MTDPTEQVAAALTGLHVDPAQSVCGCYELTPEDARQLAQAAIDALGLTEECEGTGNFGEQCRLVTAWVEQ